MILTQKNLDSLFKKQLDIHQISINLNAAGIINTFDSSSQSISVEYPTMRPDCNSVLGILLEISALFGEKLIFSDSTIPMSISHNKGDISYFIGELSGFAHEIIKQQSTIDILKSNNRSIDANFYHLLKDYCALMYGCVIQFIPSNNMLPQSIYDLDEQITIQQTQDKYSIRFMNEEWEVGNDIDSEFSDYFIVILTNPSIMKTFLDKRVGRAHPLYYTYIRKSIPIFVTIMMRQICGEHVIFHGTKELFAPKWFDYKSTLHNISSIIGEPVDTVTVSTILSYFGYVFSDNKICTPQWRMDVFNVQDIAHDIMRHPLFTKSQKKPYGTASDYKLYKAIIVAKKIHASNGFIEIMTRPFITVSQAKEIESIYNNSFQCVSVCNPCDKNKSYLMGSNYWQCCNTVTEYYSKCFEVSYLKRKYGKKVGDYLAISLAAKVRNGDEIPLHFQKIKNYLYSNGNNIIIKSSNNKIIWMNERDKDDFFLLMFIFNSDKNITVFCEYGINILMHDNDNNMDEKYIYEKNKYVTRRYSVDIPINASFITMMSYIERRISRKVAKVIIENVFLYKKEHDWFLNYRLLVFFSDISKDEIKQFNNLVYLYLQQQRDANKIID